jgi:hypothetical protein
MMRDENTLEAAVTYDPKRGYIASSPELKAAVVAPSLNDLRHRIEALFVPDIVEPILQLDRAARLERDRRQRQAPR